MQKHGPWQIVQSQEVYRDPWTAVRKDDVIRPDGQPGTHTVVTIKPGVCVLAMDDEHQVYLTEEFHYGVGRTTIWKPSGMTSRISFSSQEPHGMKTASPSSQKDCDSV